MAQAAGPGVSRVAINIFWMEMMMRKKILLALLAAAVYLPAQAHTPARASAPVLEALIPFEGVQEQCVQAGKVRFGANAPWAACRVTKGRWFATQDFIDMYQAQYCLSKTGDACDQRALLVFGNRAYTPQATVILQRLDQGNAEYDDPVLIQTSAGNVLTLSAHLPDGSISNSYHRWQKDHWVSVDASSWLKDLSRQLKAGESIKANAWPDVDAMHAQATIHRAGDAQDSDRVAEVDLEIVKDHFRVRKVSLLSKAD